MGIIAGRAEFMEVFNGVGPRALPQIGAIATVLKRIRLSLFGPSALRIDQKPDRYRKRRNRFSGWVLILCKSHAKYCARGGRGGVYAQAHSMATPLQRLLGWSICMS
eukprot:SAG11_NODE_2521_length_3261_cov_1.530993_4_plen_107_part_00